MILLQALSKKKFFIIFLILTCLGSGVGYFLLKDCPCYSTPIQFSLRNDYPITYIQIDDQHYPVYLGIGGTPSFFSLQPSILEKTKLVPSDSRELRVFNEQKNYLVKSFVLPKIKIGKLQLTNIKVEEWGGEPTFNEKKQSDQISPVGQIGSRILEKTNVILDFPNSKIWMVEDLKGLHKAGFNEKEMLKIPFELWQSAILLNVDTDVGKIPLLLSTTCSNTFVKSSLLEGKKPDKSQIQPCIFPNAKFSIEGKNFGPLPLYSHDFPSDSDWDRIDGFLGMDFLSQHVLYIDYKNKELYIGYSMRDICKALPVWFSSSNLPIIDGFIGKKRRSFMLDTGSAFQLSLNNHILKSLKRKEIGHNSFTNMKEETFVSKLYSVEDLKIGDLTFSSIQAIETKEEFSKNTRLGQIDLTYQSDIGRFVLEKINLLLDFPHRKLWQIGKLEGLMQVGFDPDKMVKVPFELNDFGMIVEADTDIGKFRLVFDTGTTVTLLKSQLLEKVPLCEGGLQGLSFYRSEKFNLGNKDFGQLNIYNWDIYPTKSEVDGVLGMNFIKQHVIYIDYPNRLLYITKPD